MIATGDTDEAMRLLVLEDSPSDFAMLEIEIRDSAFSRATIDHATTLAGARDLLLVHDYDCALVDLGVPDSDGLDTFDEVAAVSGHAAVVVLTGLANQWVAEEAVRRGAQDYLVKGSGQAAHQVTQAISYGIRRQELLEELRRATAEQLAFKDQLVSRVSHELRSPLAVVSLYVGLLGDDVSSPLTPHQQHQVDVLTRNVDQLRAMIEDLLAVRRDGRDAISIKCREVDPTQLLMHVVEGYRPVAEQHGVGLCLVLDEEALPPAMADPDRVREIMGNLIDNAVKFTAPGGRVTVSASAAVDSVHISVSDTGRGIAADALPHIFENFFQVFPGDLAGRAGLGLGLFLSKDLVVRQGGRIWAESTPGAGTTMSFTLPRAHLTPGLGV